MKELLNRWAELEPELVGRHWLEFTDDQLSLRDTAVLQFAIQQAIAARGWYFDVAYLPLRESDDKYHADVQVTKSLEGVDADLRSAKSDNPAEALLAAYVKALEHPSGYVEAPQA